MTLKSDKHLISPRNVTPESNILVSRNKGNDHRLNKLSIVEQTLLVSTFENAYRTVWSICILMLGCKGLTENLQTRGKWKKWKLCVHAVYKKNKIIVITFMMLIHFLKPILALNQNKNCYKKTHCLLQKHGKCSSESLGEQTTKTATITHNCRLFSMYP